MLICNIIGNVYHELNDAEKECEDPEDLTILKEVRQLTLKSLIMGKYSADKLVQYKKTFEPDWNWDQSDFIILSEEEEKRKLELLEREFKLDYPETYYNECAIDLHKSKFTLQKMYLKLYDLVGMLSEENKFKSSLKSKIVAGYLAASSICKKVEDYENKLGEVDMPFWDKRDENIEKSLLYKQQETWFKQRYGGKL